jgi:hypothetical protein
MKKNKKQMPLIFVVAIILGIIFIVSSTFFIYKGFFAELFQPRTTQQLGVENIFLDLPEGAKKDIDASLDGYQASIEPIGRMNIEIRETEQNSKYQSNQKYKVIDSFTMNTNAGSKKLYLLSDGSDTSIDVSECSNKFCAIKSAKTNKSYSVDIWKQRNNYKCCSNPADQFSPNDPDAKYTIATVKTLRID